MTRDNLPQMSSPTSQLPEESKGDAAHHEGKPAAEIKSYPSAGSDELTGFETDEHALQGGYYSSSRFWGSMIAIGLSTLGVT